MDVDFFKNRQRVKNVTSEDLGRAIGRDRTVISKIYSGARQMKPEEVVAFAQALDLSVEDVLEHAGLKRPAVVRAMVQPPGLAEPEAAPYAWQPADVGRDLTGAFGLGNPGVEAWTVKGRSMNLAGYLDGDALVVDRNRVERVRSGDAVLAQIYDFGNGSARTVFRRYDPPFIFAISTDQDDLKPYLVDGERVVIVGVVTFSWRGRAGH